MEIDANHSEVNVDIWPTEMCYFDSIRKVPPMNGSTFFMKKNTNVWCPLCVVTPMFGIPYVWCPLCVVCGVPYV